MTKKNDLSHTFTHAHANWLSRRTGLSPMAARYFAGHEKPAAMANTRLASFRKMAEELTIKHAPRMAAARPAPQAKRGLHYLMH